ncbi:MAG TPA: PVC-type heme-binding CxxCH protein [Verrucomicrobiae bacterium]
MPPVRTRISAVLSSALLGALAASPLFAADDPFAAGVRTTEPLTPEQESKTFHLPPGFEMQLVTTEPHINKPMNMAFDVAGRLWVTTSIEYPFPATTNAPRDRIMIFEDFAPDGKARKITEFAGGLNIPIGVYPFRSPSSKNPSKLSWKCIAWSIPNIWLFEDIDGDGKADKKEMLYGPFDFSKDTHGNQASFRRGFDGWLYATHGFNNNTKVAGKDGNELVMSSGNTYRMQLGGVRMEHHTWGQVNPFGLCFDPQGNLYSADCHSSPIYQLLRGAYYPSFGKPHDGLGFAPLTIQHSHGSTAICGIQMITDPSWPKEFQGNLIIGNVMTSRINRDRVEWLGSTSKGHEVPDFLRTDDPWFRPVDMQFGPDGALYVADFYNRIIGHYEVPLLHPGRDRERGRIWRIVYRGEDGKAVLPATRLPEDLKGLVAELGSPNMTRRMLAMNTIADVHGKAFAKQPLKTPKSSADEQSPEVLRYVHSLWLRERLGVLKDSELEQALKAPAAIARVHALRILADRGLKQQSPPSAPALSQSLQKLLVNALNDSAPLVQRTAAEALSQQTKVDGVKALLALIAKVPEEDTHLKHMARLALRNQLSGAGAWALTQANSFTKEELTTLVDIALGLKSEAAAVFLLKNQDVADKNMELRTRILQNVARYAPASALDELADTVQKQRADDLDFQLSLFQTVEQGFKQRGQKLTPKLQTWGKALAPRLFTKSTWGNTPLDGKADKNPWALQERSLADGTKAQVISSFPLGEKLTGVLRSSAFELPEKLSFYLCGHDGIPGKPLLRKNFIRLREAGSDAVLFEVTPPRNDAAQLITWDLAAHKGKKGYIEAIDDNTDTAYAWFAFGRFEPALPQVATVDPSQTARFHKAAAELAKSLELRDLQPQLTTLLRESGTDSSSRAAAASAVANLKNDSLLSSLATALTDATVPEETKQSLVTAFTADKANAREAIVKNLQHAPTRVLQKLVLILAGSPEGAELVLSLAEENKIAAATVAAATVKEKLSAAKPQQWEARLNKLTASLPPEDAARNKLITERRLGFVGAKTDARKGGELFTTVCAACHQVKGKGGLVGPQLDGIMSRGTERVIEDILDPNRNVDHAFRSHTITLKDGDVTTGLPRREEGEVLVIANSAGIEVSIPKKDIKERKESANSLMPDNFGEALTPEQLYDLLAFLLNQK